MELSLVLVGRRVRSMHDLECIREPHNHAVEGPEYMCVYVYNSITWKSTEQQCRLKMFRIFPSSPVSPQ